MRKFLLVLFALLLTGCKTNQDVKIPSAAERLADGILAFSDEITINCDENELKTIFSALWCERADWFYLQPQLRYTVRGDTITLYPTYSMEEETAEAYQTAFLNRAASFSESLSPSLSVMDRALLLHDRLLRAVQYDAKRDFPLADALLAGYADCEGYARAYQFLLQQNGIDALYVTGEANGGGHAWVLFCDEDGIWYHADPTWNDGETLSRAYFMQSDAVMRQTHTLRPLGGMIYPACTGEDDAFYKRSGLYGMESVAAAIDHARAWETGAAELCMEEACTPEMLARLDVLVQTEGEKRNLHFTKRIFSKNRRILAYIPEG